MRFVIIILLFSVQASGQVYFVIPTMNNPANKANLISRKFYQLSKPTQGTDTTTYLMCYVRHPLSDSIALEIDSTFDLPKGNINATNITEWITETYPNITQTQINTLTNYINSNNLLRIGRLILTNRIKLWTRAELTARGWFDFNL